MKVFPQAFQDDGSKSQSSTSRQITVPAPRWLGLGGDGEGGQRPPFNTRLNRNALLEWATAGGANWGRGVVEADTKIRTCPNEVFELRVFPQAFQDDGSKSQSVSVRAVLASVSRVRRDRSRPTAAVQHTSQSKRASRVGDGGRGDGAEALLKRTRRSESSRTEHGLESKSRWRSTVQSESDLNQRLCSEVKTCPNEVFELRVFPQAFQDDGSKSQSSTSRQITVPAPRWLGLGGDGEGGQRPPFNTRLNRNALLEWATAGGAGEALKRHEDPSQVELNTVLRASQDGVQLFKASLISISVFAVKSRCFRKRFKMTGPSLKVTSRQITVPAPRWLGLGGDGEGGQRPPFNTRLNRNALLEWATAGGAGEALKRTKIRVFPQAFQDDASKSQSSTSRQITVPAPRWLGLGGDGEGGQRPPFNTRLNRNALLEWATAGGAGEALKRTKIRVFPQAFQDDGSKSQSSTSRQITVPAPRWLGLGGDGEGGQRPPFNTRLNRNALLEWATAGGARGEALLKRTRRSESTFQDDGSKSQSSTSRQITVPAPRWLGLGGDGEGGQRPPFNMRLNRNALLEWATAGGARGEALLKRTRRSESTFQDDGSKSQSSTSRQITVPAPRWLGLGGDGEGGQRPPFNMRLNRNALLEWATAGRGEGAEALLKRTRRSESTFQDDGSKSQSSTSRQITVPAPRWLGLGGDGEGGQRPPFNMRLNRNALLEWATAGRGEGAEALLKRTRRSESTFQDDGSKSQSSTSRQITVPAPRWLGLGGDGEGGQRPPFNMRLNRNALLEWATAGRARGRGVVEADTKIRTCPNEVFELRVFPQAFQDDGSKSQSSTSRQITVPAPRWLGLGGDGEGGQRPPFNMRLNRNALLEWATAGGARGRGVVEADTKIRVKCFRKRFKMTGPSLKVRRAKTEEGDVEGMLRSVLLSRIDGTGPRWLGLGGDGEGGRWPPFNTRLNRNALLEWATAGGAGRGVEADEDPSQVAVLRGKSRWRSTVQSESDLNKRLCSEVKVKANSRLSTD
ncbi:hypothetical protein BDZ89DRAFT_1034132 [Hymenopellis radicata]|nr:hypothetical protein BDZ89DRAFT_1034132 [Hymenopellis radicata]